MNGINIRKARERQGLTQAEAAEKFGVSEKTWQKLVNQIKQDFKMTRAGNYRKKKFIE